MAIATIERRYALKMTESEAETLISVLNVVYLTGAKGDGFDAHGENLTHLFEEMKKTGLVARELPLAVGD